MPLARRMDPAPPGRVPGRSRLFFALLPEGDTRDRLHAAAIALKHGLAPHGRWISPHRYHLTLLFLGDFAEDAEDVARRSATAARGVDARAFTLVLDRAGSFRGRSCPWWLGPGGACPGLDALRSQLGRATGELGVGRPDAHLFRPHVTVLRDASQPLAETDIAAIGWRVRSFALVQSALGANHAYTTLGTWPLAD